MSARPRSRAGLKARIEALEWVLIQTGRWTDDSDVGLIQVSGDPMDRKIADEILDCVDRLKKLEARTLPEPSGKGIKYRRGL